MWVEVLGWDYQGRDSMYLNLAWIKYMTDLGRDILIVG